MSTLTTTTLDECRCRLRTGDKLANVARTTGLHWQTLHKLLKQERTPDLQPPKLRRSVKLVDCYRPCSLSEVRGQTQVTSPLQRFVAEPYSTAMLLEGETGTGKTSAALALARDLGCDVGEEELGGVTNIASGEQTADNVRDLNRSLRLRPMYGSGWKVAIINECDRMNPAAETLWLDRLEPESLPAKCVFVFTTNRPEKLSQRFLDRCDRFAFTSDSATLRPAAIDLLRSIWLAEVEAPLNLPVIEDVVAQATHEGQLSLRRCVQMFQQRLA